MVASMKILFLFTLIIISTSAHSLKPVKVWELELQIQGETSRLVIELTDEVGESCLIANPRKVKTLKGKVPNSKHFSGYSYSVKEGVLSIDMFPLLCDGGNLLRGKIQGDTISGKILSSSFAGLKNVGSFNGKAAK